MLPIGMQSAKKRVNKRVYFLVPAPLGISPGQRFRFEHYLKHLEEKNIGYTISSFYDSEGWKIIFKKGGFLKKIAMVLKGFGKRYADLFRMRDYDYVFIYREAAPVGPPFFEWIIAKFLKKKIIYDFDDSIWVPFSSQYNRIALYLKWFSKIAVICRWSYRLSVGNDYLRQFSSQYNQNVVIIPTVVDTKDVHNQIKDHSENPLAIGWTGTFSTLKYLNLVLPVLQKLQERFDFDFIVIADNDPALPLKKYKFIRWNKETEAADILMMHIGLMPLYNDEVSWGKCGLKAIQYMALGIPPVVSPVGVNNVIIDHGQNGFICNGPQEWETALEKLLTETSLRTKMGATASLKIESDYSVKATIDNFTALFS
jgi:glycosyltransferase involved in cell wall biosynthesis